MKQHLRCVLGFLAVLCLCVLFISPHHAFAGGKPIIPGPVSARIVSVYDGDTLTVDIPQWPSIAGKRIGVRVKGVDTPEMKDKRPHIRELALTAKVLVATLCPNGSTAELTNIERGKYFRLVASVSCGGQDVATALLAVGLANPYDGGTKTVWE